MSDYYISQIYPSDKRANAEVDALLVSEGIRRDANLDYTCGMYDDEMHIIATGSCFGNTLRCFAVSHEHQGEGLMNSIVSHLIEFQFSRGNTHLFLYTKCNSAKFFGDLGFYEIARIDGQIVFMENRKTGFQNYLRTFAKDALPEGLTAETPTRKIAALVMNANPFTLGHQYLVEKAAAENDLLHLFIVSEDASLVPFKIRKQLVMKGTAHLKNICYHDSGPYIISNATFPSYFQKDENAVIESHAMLDLTVFTQIAKVLGITRRYVGKSLLAWLPESITGSCLKNYRNRASNVSLSQERPVRIHRSALPMYVLPCKMVTMIPFRSWYRKPHWIISKVRKQFL